MKSVNAKRIAALAASVALGIAFAAPVSFSNIPIVNSAGQPVVQLVIGSTAKPSDGVVAANIAAVIGNLAFTSTPVTATVGGTSGLTCAVTAPSCTLSNQEVWLGEKGTVTAAGSYSFKAAIGSVIDGALLNFNQLNGTKQLQGSGQYSYPQYVSSPYPITSSPTATSPFAGVGSISLPTSVTASTNGGGVQFTRMTQTGGYDNILRLSQSQVPGLLQNSGSYSESEYLWVMGFPVYDQATGVNNFAVLDAGSAYQVVFGNPIGVWSSGSTVNHSAFKFNGANWTIFNATPPAVVEPPSNQFVVGGKLQLASASTGLTTLYVGQNLTSGNIKVTLQDLSYPNSNGVANAALAVYNNGVLTNETSVAPGTSLAVNSSGTKTYLYVQQTFPGLYSYQKWAKVQLFSSITNVTSGKVFNNNGKWISTIWWTTNQSTAPTASFSSTNFALDANAFVAGLVLYSNQSQSTTLTPGSTLNVGSNWKLTFAGDSFGTPGSGNSNYDPLTFSTAGATGSYANPSSTASSSATPVTDASWTSAGGYAAGSGAKNLNTTLITEPQQVFTVTSSVPSAFQLTNTPSNLGAPASSISSVTYDLNGYQFVATNTVNALGVSNLRNSAAGGLVVYLTNTQADAGNYVNNNNQLTVTVSGFQPGASSPTSTQVTFSKWDNVQTVPGYAFGNVTNIEPSYAIPNGLTIQVYDSANVVFDAASTNGIPGIVPDAANMVLGATNANAIILGKLSTAGPLVLYSSPSFTYSQSAPATTQASTATGQGTANVLYTVEGSNLPFTLVQYAPSNVGSQQYFTYNVPEIVLPSSTSASANTILGLYNASTLLATPAYWLNQTNGNNNYLQYAGSSYSTGSQNTVKAGAGFRTERGSEVASISTSSVTYDMAKSVDTLQFLAGPGTSTVASTTTNYGPYGIGQATNIPNVTIANVSAKCSFAASSTSCTVSGVKNLTATPSVTSAQQSVGLNTALTPLAVLDSNANNASTLIVVGSLYVNSVAGQIFAQNPGFASSFGTSSVVVQAFGTNRILVAGYTANQTVQAGNQFIQDLLQSAAAGK